jgi:hypothetical protein
MHRQRSTLLLTVSVLAIFMASFIADTSQLTIKVEAQTADEGGGKTNNENKRIRIDSVSSTPVLSLDQAEAESQRGAGDTISDEDATERRICALPGGLDHVAAGTGARNTGNGTIRIQGVPGKAKVVQAFLYWGVIIPDVLPYPSEDTVNLNGHRVAGKRIGNAEQPCWVGDANGEYVNFKADVTRFIPPVINGDYAVDDIDSGITDGSDPWPLTTGCSPSPTLPLAEGASLIIIYSSPSVPAGARVYIHENIFTFANQLDINHTLAPAMPAHTLIKHTRIGADGGTGCSVAAQEQITDEKTFFGQSVATLFQIKGDPVGGLTPALNRDSDWNGGDAGSLNQLWDTHTSGFRPSVNGIDPVPAGATSYVVRYQSRGDCIVAVVHVMSVQ